MKIQIPKEWFVSRAQRETGLEIGAGSPKFFAGDAVPVPLKGDFVAIEQRLSFSHFISLMRRRNGWTIQQLAQKSDVDVGELVIIERGSCTEPELSTVYGLAKALAFPVKKLIRMAGLAEDTSPRLAAAGVNFLASAETVEPLTRDEQNALKTYIEVVLEESGKK